ncbi:hypothetical protein CLV28_0208 [Sediminihabitans luteus]|uniref:Mannosyltransferase PIG-V n=1 Tax=Sediminihabitans luteus TaxID=1138585 RepID=A0A2M9CYI9_9CELL|nr:hypothetical protein [Sediminihabitans luteus]PJJ76996.1 hypothetical protein CLV28_0208 [Sediminihabitans luteus]GII99637.1 hypothetical protein Slu03_20150 [Sediminihabitans luteus]
MTGTTTQDDAPVGAADTPAAKEQGTRVRGARWPGRWPWWLRVLAVYGLARAVSAAIIMIVAQHQAENYWTGAQPGYLEYTGSMWDASWYEQVARDGYPAELPRGDDGLVQQNAWAFYPLFPVLVRGLMEITTLPWDVVAPILCLVLGAIAMLVIHQLVAAAPRAVARHPGLPLATVAVVATVPSSPVLQVAYTEALALLLISTTLLLIVRHRYEWAALSVVGLGFTRAVALPMACVVVWHGLHRAYGWWRLRRAALAAASAPEVGASDAAPAASPAPPPFPWLDGIRVAALLAVAVLSGFLWQWICAARTGVPDAYFLTQQAWRGTGPVEIFTPWVEISQMLWGERGPWYLGMILVATAAVVLSPPMFRLGPELQAWTGAYLAYLVAVIEPWTSLWRFLLLAFPLGAVAVSWPRPRWAARACLAVVVAAGVYGQWYWVWNLWQLVPPSGWPP